MPHPVTYALIDSQNLNIFKPYVRFVSDLRKKLEYVPRNKKSPRKDETLKGTSSIGDTSIVTNKSKKVDISKAASRKPS